MQEELWKWSQIQPVSPADSTEDPPLASLACFQTTDCWEQWCESQRISLISNLRPEKRSSLSVTTRSLSCGPKSRRWSSMWGKKGRGGESDRSVWVGAASCSQKYGWRGAMRSNCTRQIGTNSHPTLHIQYVMSFQFALNAEWLLFSLKKQRTGENRKRTQWILHDRKSPYILTSKSIEDSL